MIRRTRDANRTALRYSFSQLHLHRSKILWLDGFSLGIQGAFHISVRVNRTLITRIERSAAYLLRILSAMIRRICVIRVPSTRPLQQTLICEYSCSFVAEILSLNSYIKGVSNDFTSLISIFRFRDDGGAVYRIRRQVRYEELRHRLHIFPDPNAPGARSGGRSEEHTSEL